MTSAPDHACAPKLSEAFGVWLKIGVLSFGGPAGQISLMHRLLVEERRWIDEARFLHALNYCMLLPGPEAQQLATYIGWLLNRTVGGLVAGALFVLPGALVILVLSAVYALYAQIPIVAAVFMGVKAAVLVVVIEAIMRIGRRALKTLFMCGIAVIAFLAIFVFSVPFPVIVLGAALIGLFGGFFRTKELDVIKNHESAGNGPASIVDMMAVSGELEHTSPSPVRSLFLIAIFGLLWGGPVFFSLWWLGESSVFVQEAMFFSKLAVVTFGGAYAVLAYMAQQAVETYNWLSGAEMLDGLGLAETTPGPLIMVTQFVGFLGAYRHAVGIDPMLAGVLGSIVTVWVTFVPCFFWIFIGAPYIERLRDNSHLTAALSGITAAVVGVILNLALWFGLRVMFDEIDYVLVFGLQLSLPNISTVNYLAVGLTALAGFSMLRFHQGVIPTLGICGGTALVAHVLMGL